METKVISIAAAGDFIRTLRFSAVIGTLLCGDRIWCCDEAVTLEHDGVVVGLATIAPLGEMRSGVPTIVAVYVLPNHRGRGYTRPLLEAVIRRCLERGFAKTQIEVMSGRLMKVVQALPDDLKVALDVVDCGDIMDFLSDEEV